MKEKQLTDNKRKIVYVSAVVMVDGEGRILLAQRPEGRTMAGLWEFPGGKIEPGETPAEALIRELKEELDIDIAPDDLSPLTFVSYDYVDFHLFMPVFLCRNWQGVVLPREAQAFAWVPPAELENYSMPAADRPLVPYLQKHLQHAHQSD
jgi:8-oxo-dGTP diphosphatase